MCIWKLISDSFLGALTEILDTEEVDKLVIAGSLAQVQKLVRVSWVYEKHYMFANKPLLARPYDSPNAIRLREDRNVVVNVDRLNDERKVSAHGPPPFAAKDKGKGNNFEDHFWPARNSPLGTCSKSSRPTSE